MAFIEVPNTASLQVIFEVAGNRCQNVINVHQNNPFSAVTMANACEIYVSWWASTGKDLSADDAQLTKIVATSLESESAESIEYVIGLPIAGGDTTNASLPLNVTACVSFGTEKRGRSYRGRLYQVALTSSRVSGNLLTTGYRSLLISAYAELISDLQVGGFEMVVVSRYANRAARGTGVTTKITSVSVDPNVDSQRRRLNGRGQ
jgi:hypothetical protein